ncbi:MAG: hypothetical protein KDB27_06070 [Planctomycetales bacterium]|nr:hypothetical protein [Planctomycetales bacterium]
MNASTAQHHKRTLGMLAIFMVVSGSGCARWRLPAIDPSGERIFLPSPNYTTINTDDGYARGIPARSPIGRALGAPGPVFPGAETPPECPDDLVAPNQPTANLQNSPDSRGISTPPAVPRVMVPGCFQRPDGKTCDLLNRGAQYEGAVVIKPRRLVAPVGSEVILVGGICDGEGFYKTRESIEWVLQEGSVGTFTEPGDISEGLLGYRKPLGGLFSEIAPELISPRYAISCTSKKVQVLTRGTPDPSDDVFVLNGQGWIGLTSAQEGTSYVTLFAPNLEATTGRQTNSVVHWVDGQWTLPPSVAAQNAGPQTLTTTVRRKLTDYPIAGWIVRYEVVGGAPALLDGQPGPREVVTDSMGNASVQITPDGAQSGTTQVQVQVIRPSRGTGEPDRLIIGQGHTEVTWNAANLEVSVQGPESVEIDGDVDYQIQVRNPASMAVTDVTVRSLIPVGFDYIASSPEGQPFGAYVDWTIDRIEPGQSATINARYRAGQSGRASHCVTARSPNAPNVEHCVETFVTSNALLIELLGPTEDSVFEVGEIATYDITITNRGDRSLSDITVIDEFDAGLQQRQLTGERREDLTGSIRRTIPDLAPGESDQFQLNFVVVGSGRLCHTITARTQGAKTATRTLCFNAVLPTRDDFQVELTGPSQMTVGEQDVFGVDVENTGDRPLTNLRIAIELPNELVAISSQPTTRVDESNRVIWLVDKTIPVGGKLSESYQVLCEPDIATQSAVCRVVVTTNGLERSDAVDFTILPRGDAEPPPLIPNDTNDENFGYDPNDRFDDDQPSVERANPDSDPFGGSSVDESRDVVDRINSSNDKRALDVELVSRTEKTVTDDGTKIRLIYVVVVTNMEEVYDQDVNITVNLSRKVALNKYSGPSRVDYQENDWHTLHMKPIETLRDGDSVKYLVEADIVEPGEIITDVVVYSERQKQPIRVVNNTSAG